jgi:hypothetical protein
MMHAAAQCRLATATTRTLAATIAKGLCFGLLATGFAAHQAAASDDAAPLSGLSRLASAHVAPAPESAAAPSTINARPVAAQGPKRANFERERASHDARYLADWVVDSGDNKRMPFAIVDKVDARVYVFGADGRLRGAAAALLGIARGDDSAPGIGDLPLSGIPPGERTTPAGRFVAALDRDEHGKTILWVDYDDGVALHAVITTNPKERRLQRLATPTPLDNRISYGCINVPAKFFQNVVRPAFTGTNGIVYVLPETKPASKVFASYDVEAHARLQSASQPASAQVVSSAAVSPDAPSKN